MNPSDYNNLIRPSEAPPGIAYTKRYAYDGSNNLEYEGLAKSSLDPDASAAVWAIRKYTYADGNLTLVQWANGDATEFNIWDNRASLTYK